MIEIRLRLRQYVDRVADPLCQLLCKCVEELLRGEIPPVKRSLQFDLKYADSGEVDQGSEVKAISIPAIPFRSSERSDAGGLIVAEVIGIVKRTSAGMGCRGRNGA